jgi:hypothetical protein
VGSRPHRGVSPGGGLVRLSSVARLRGGSEFLVAFFECFAQLKDLLVEAVDLVAQSSSISRGAEPGALTDLAAEQFGQALLQAVGVVSDASGAVVRQVLSTAGGTFAWPRGTPNVQSTTVGARFE